MARTTVTTVIGNCQACDGEDILAKVETDNGTVAVCGECLPYYYFD